MVSMNEATNPDSSSEAPRDSSRTPHFEAIHALRYQRQALIERIQARSGVRLLCYVAGINAQISRADIVSWADLLHLVPASTAVDVLLQTPGGDVDAAAKMWRVLRARVGEAAIRVIVADYAKSAGTLMALGADLLVMSDSSELGPIDPQSLLTDGSGNRFPHSVINYLEAHQELLAALAKNPTDTAAQIQLAKFHPATVKLFRSIRDRALRLAEDQLKTGMFKGGNGNYTMTARRLMYGSETESYQQWHGQMIGWEDAQDAKFGLRVSYVPPETEPWRDIWSLHCLQRVAVGEDAKLFESHRVSLLMSGEI
jgi:ATP-dependent protease ClpP protease subunit